ncbi:MAG TPA: DUF4352 domain-containing protein [Pseudogracilibacillus sp.]|nr:DUF4352 domain-containing protein [Pseudogracilibacillus sp.]
MIKAIKSVLILSISLLVLGACGNKDTTEEKIENNDSEIEAKSSVETESEDIAEEQKGQDQLDLVIGDTGTFDTTLGTYEMTLDKAELKGEEYDDVITELDEIILLDITIKNTGDKVLDISELIVSMEITDDLDHSGDPNSADLFENVEEFTGNLEPGEEKSGQFITETFDSDEYFFRKDPGSVAGGSSNQVIWIIQKDEIK